jgi:hypothetical protein
MVIGVARVMWPLCQSNSDISFPSRFSLAAQLDILIPTDPLPDLRRMTCVALP